LVFLGSACSISLPAPAEKTIIQTTQVTQLATILVTKEVTQEVTRVVEVPVTVTPADTPLVTLTPSVSSSISGSPAPSPAAPEVTILEHADCLYGPGLGYLYKYSVFPNNPMEAIGRNLDGSWLYIQNVGGWNPCWIQSALVKVPGGDINGLPIVYSKLPYSNQYNSPDATARREGTEVTISWKADWMSLDDYRGYLIEAWICQGGVLIFDPIIYIPPLASNTGSLSVKVTDEPGCVLPSIVRIYSAQKQGYSIGSNVPWPPAIATPGP
jgi:hypothetical protein